MFAPINSENERIRAEATLSSLTQHDKAVDMFAPRSPQGEHPCAEDNPAERSTPANRNNGQSIMRVFNAIKLNRRPAIDEPDQQPVY